MTLFRAQIDAFFYADDIADALYKLADHLVTPLEGEESDLLLPPSAVDVRPAEESERESA